MIEANSTKNSNPAESRISRSFKTRMVYPSTFSPKLFTLFILLRMKTEMIFHFQIIYKLFYSLQKLFLHPGFNNIFPDCIAHLKCCFIIRTEVNAGIETRVGTILSKMMKLFCIGREKIFQHCT